jgi:hypothetical protein
VTRAGRAGRAAGEPRRGASPEATGAAALDTVWRVLALVGIALAAAAVATVLPAWLTPRFGDADWELGTMADMAAVLPLLAIGLGGCLVAAVGLRRRRALLALGIGFVALGVVTIACLLLFAPTAMLAVRNAQGGPPALALGLQRVVARTVWSDLVGIVGCAAAAMAALRLHRLREAAGRA